MEYISKYIYFSSEALLSGKRLADADLLEADAEVEEEGLLEVDEDGVVGVEGLGQVVQLLQAGPTSKEFF